MVLCHASTTPPPSTFRSPRRSVPRSSAASWPRGARLTSTTEYATRYRINPATANKAVALLVDEGLVAKRRGIGMFVADGALADLRRSRRAAYTDDVLHPALDTGLALGLDDAELRDAVVQYLESHARKESQ